MRIACLAIFTMISLRLEYIFIACILIMLDLNFAYLFNRWMIFVAVRSKSARVPLESNENLCSKEIFFQN